ncbi:hypothetical protein JW711_03810 [Candidatus Woesearchaeota archaeon]|nr:hypothetical protein [Candidatus Woesearchaeota archaeon]
MRKIMQINIALALAITAVLLITGCGSVDDQGKIIGGERDEHGCLGPAGYSWNETVGACVREWELDEGQREAARLAVLPMSYRPITIIKVDTLRCPGCYDVYLQGPDRGEPTVMKFRDWKITQSDEEGNEESVICAQDVKECPDGTFVSRDPENNCEFERCLDEGESDKTYCRPEQRGEDIACTMEYNPVCGWFNEDIKCIKYPCAANYGNACGACSDEKVYYWTPGECPKD